MITAASNARVLVQEAIATQRLRRQKVQRFLTGSYILRMRILRKYRHLLRRKDLIFLLIELGEEQGGLTPIHFKIFELLADFPMLSLTECKKIFLAYRDNVFFYDIEDLFSILEYNCEKSLHAKNSSY
jgi:hypothetical protein